MVEVLFFAELQEKVGSEKLLLDDAVGISIKDLRHKLLSSYDLETHHAIVAVNEEYVQDDTVLKDKDVVAFIPPVSGG